MRDGELIAIHASHEHPVIAIDGRRVGSGLPGPVTRRVQELYKRKSAMRAGAAEGLR